MQADRLLAEVLHSMNEALVVARADGRIAVFNEGAERMFGYRKADVLGKPLEMLIPPASRAAHEQYVAVFARGKEPRRFMTGRPDIKGLRRDGTTFDAEASISRFSHEGETFLVAVVQDLSALRRLREIERSLTNAQRMASLGNWEWNIETGELWWSDEIYRIFGQSPRSAAVTYDAFLQTVHPDDRDLLQQAVDEALYSGAEYDLEHRIVRPDGSVRTVREQGEVVFEGGRAVRMTGLVHDITDRILMEARLRQAQKLETLGRLTGGIAHDFNNLLTVVMGNLEIAQGELGEGHAVTEFIDEALRAVELASSLTERLLVFSRRQNLRPETVQLDKMLESIRPMLQRTAGDAVRLELISGERLWSCVADPNQLKTVILNMVINARDAMPGGGTLTVRIDNVTLSVSDAREKLNASPGDYLRLSIADTGEGMTPSVQERVFEPFFTTKAQGRGTGLGLSTAYGFVTQSGGFIEIDSEPGRGTTFHLHLPRAAARDGLGRQRAMASR